MINPRFWLCMVDGKGAPVTRHKLREEANNEAKRLAASNNGLAVYVLEAIHYYQVAAPEPTLFRTADE